MLNEFKKLNLTHPDLQKFQEYVKEWTEQLRSMPTADQLNNALTSIASLESRYKRPSYYFDGTDIIVPASSAKPARFYIDGTSYTVTSDLSLTPSGLSANTPYYLYATLSGETVVLELSATSPATRTGSAWTYLGAASTEDGSATLRPFQSLGGMYISKDSIESYSFDGGVDGTGPHEQAFAAMPTTASQAYFALRAEGANAGGTARVTSGSSTTDSVLIVAQQVSGVNNYINGWVPILTNQTVWIRLSNSANDCRVQLLGWQEEPWRYQ